MYKVSVKIHNSTVLQYVVESRGDVNIIDGIVFINAVDTTALFPITSVFAVEITEVQA